MPINIQHRSFLRLIEFSGKEIRNLLDLSRELKQARQEGYETQMLKGKNIVLLFEKNNIHTRCAFEVAASEQGMNVTYIDMSASHLSSTESVKDTAKVLGRLYSGIVFLGFHQETVDSLARFSGIPVWNAGSDHFHPTRILADLLTMQEHCDKPLRKISCCYLGNARSNIGNSLIEAAGRIGFDLRMAAPKKLFPSPQLVEMAAVAAKETHGKITLTESLVEAVKDADFIYTEPWFSMHENPEHWQEKIDLMKPYQVTMEVLEMANNPKVRFLHGLPACHNRDSAFGEEIFQRLGLESLEVTQQVFDSPACVVFDQAENRLHTIKAIMIASLGE